MDLDASKKNIMDPEKRRNEEPGLLRDLQQKYFK
jgi:hypothetical protein